MKTITDRQLRNRFSAAAQQMPANLEAQLLTIPQTEAATSLQRFRAIYALAASVAAVVLFGESMGHLLHAAGSAVGGWSLRLLSTAQGVIYEAVMPQVAPWLETTGLLSLPLLTILVMAVATASISWSALRSPANRRFVLPYQS